MTNYFYRRIRDLREDHDLSQEQVAALLDIHRTTYARYERGECQLTLPLAIKIAYLYNVSLYYLAELEDE